jgi:hypothetical protein
VPFSPSLVPSLTLSPHLLMCVFTVPFDETQDSTESTHLSVDICVSRGSSGYIWTPSNCSIPQVKSLVVAAGQVKMSRLFSQFHLSIILVRLTFPFSFSVPHSHSLSERHYGCFFAIVERQKGAYRQYKEILGFSSTLYRSLGDGQTSMDEEDPDAFLSSEPFGSTHVQQASSSSVCTLDFDHNCLSVRSHSLSQINACGSMGLIPLGASCITD